MTEIQNIIDDLYNGESIVEDDQKLIKSALKLQELVKERITEMDAKRKEAYYPSKKRGVLYKRIKVLQSLVTESEE